MTAVQSCALKACVMSERRDGTERVCVCGLAEQGWALKAVLCLNAVLRLNEIKTMTDDLQGTEDTGSGQSGRIPTSVAPSVELEQ